ncbi:MAG: hypothetical protein EPN60_16075 [Nevskiaceae bacterium]|nr:MAG: hypothetical protein EPN60_16075 [Nevskiaceae bacterium]
MDIKTLIDSARKGRPARQLAQEIGCSAQQLNDIDKGRTPCPAWVAARLAEIAGADPVAAQMQALADAAKTEAERTLWGRLLKKQAGLTIAAILMAGVFYEQKPLYANELENSAHLIHCVQF